MSTPTFSTTPTSAQSMGNDPLSQLADIHLPPEVSSFPWAPGWWVLLLLGALTIVVLISWLIKRHRSKAWLRSALTELQRLEESTQHSDTEFAQALNQLLRRIAIRQYGKETAGLSGESWINFLSKNMKIQNQGTYNQDAYNQFQILLTASYSPQIILADKTQLSLCCRRWILAQSRHKNAPESKDV